MTPPTRGSPRPRRPALGAKRLRSLEALTHAALAHIHDPSLLAELLGQMREVMHADNAAILLIDDDGQHLTLRTARGLEEAVTGQIRIPISAGVAGRIVATRAPLVVDDLASVDVADPFLREHLRSLVGAPLLVGNRVLGVIHVDHAQPRYFTTEDARILELVAERIAFALDYARLLAEAERGRRSAEAHADEVRAILDAMADGVLIYDREARISHANQAAMRMMGYDPQSEVLGQSIEARAQAHELRDAAGRPVAPDQFPTRYLLRGVTLMGTSAQDYQVRTLDGREMDINLSGAPLRDGDGSIRGAVLTMRDVTARRHLERRTREALDALLAMAESLVELPGEIAPGDQSTNEGDHGRATATATDIVPERPRRSAMAQRLAELTCGVLGCSRVGILAVEPETALMRAVAVVGLAPDQERQWWSEQAALEAQELRFGDGADPEVLARFVAGEPVVIDMREPPYSALPNPYNISTSLYAPMRLGEAVAGILSIDYGGLPHTFTTEERTLASAVAKLAALVIERERLLREREQARANELALREANQRMDEFIHIVTHELHNPLTALKSSIQVAVRRLERLVASPPDDGASSLSGGRAPHVSQHIASASPANPAPLDALRDLLERADRQTDRLRRLMGELIDASRAQTGNLDLKLAPVDLVALARECVMEQQQVSPGRMVRLQLPLATHAINIVADGERIRQVITNYLSNALKYSPANQPVDVRLTLHDTEVRVAVLDHGPGLPPAEQQRVWERFQRASGVGMQNGSARGVGLGLGLYISRQIVERHGGMVGVESVPGEGAEFWFTLPAAPRAAEG